MCACKNFVKLLNSFLLLILQKKTVFLQSISKIIKMKKVIVTLICGGGIIYMTYSFTSQALRFVILLSL